MKAPRTAILKVKTKKEDRYGVAVQILLDLGIVDTVEDAEELVETRITFIDTNRLGLDPNDDNDFQNILEIVKNHYGILGHYSIDDGKTQLFKDPRILSSIKTAYAQGYNFDPKKFLGRKLFGEDKKQDKEDGEDKLTEEMSQYMLNEYKEEQRAKKRAKLRKMLFGEEETETEIETEKLSSDQNFTPSKTSSVPQQKLIPDPWEDSSIPPESPKPTNKLGLLTDIRESVQGILGLLETKQDALRDAAEKERIAAENAARQKEEEDLEAKGDKDTDGGALEKAAKPVKSFLEKIGSFLTKFLLAKTVFALFEWMQKPGNRKKLDNLVEFLVDWAPVFLTGFLLFATPLVPMITGFVIGTKVLIAKMLLATAKVAGFIAAHPVAALTAGGITALALGALHFSNKKNKTDKLVDKSVEESGIEETSNKIKDQQKNRNPLQKVGDFVTGAGQERKEQIQKLDTGTEKRYGFFGEIKPKDEVKPKEMNKGGQVPGRGANKDTVPAMLTPGEFVMSRDAVDQWGVSTLEGMNAAAGGTNRPTIRGGYNEGGKVKMSEQLGHTRGTVTDPKEKARIEAETLHWVNKERVEFLGLPPLDKISYADGVELTKPMGKEFYGAGITEESSDDMNFDTMTRTTTRWKQRGSEIIFEGASERLTEEDKQAYLDSNPEARMMLELGDKMELDALGADISASAKMNGGGLVQYLNRGGLVEDYKALKLERSRLQRDPDGRLTGKNRKKWNQLSKEMDTLAKQIISYDKSTSTNNKTTNNKKSKKGGGFGLKRMIGGAADMATGHMFDFDKRSGGGLLRKTAGALARPMGGLADQLTGNLFDFDKRSGGGLIRKTAGAVGGLFGGRDKTQKTKSSGNIRPSQDPNSLRYKQIQALRNSAEGNMNKGPITKSNLTQGSKRMKVTIPEPRVKKRGGSSSRAITLPAINQSSGASSSSLPSQKEQVPDLPISTNPTRRMNRAIMGLGG